MDSYYKALPKLVFQTFSTSCWAAVIESWLGILPGRKVRTTQAELLDMYPDKTYADGSVIPSELEGEIAKSFGMACEWIAPSSLTAEFVAKKLSTYGHLVIGYSRGSRGGHVVVCYGVGRPTGSQQLVSVMDPSNGDGGYRNREFSKFVGMPSQGSKLFIGWPDPNIDLKYF